MQAESLLIGRRRKKIKRAATLPIYNLEIRTSVKEIMIWQKQPQNETDALII